MLKILLIIIAITVLFYRLYKKPRYKIAKLLNKYVDKDRNRYIFISRGWSACYVCCFQNKAYKCNKVFKYGLMASAVCSDGGFFRLVISGTPKK